MIVPLLSNINILSVYGVDMYIFICNTNVYKRIYARNTFYILEENWFFKKISQQGLEVLYFWFLMLF